MSFLQPEVTDSQTWILIDGDAGTTFIPAEIDPLITAHIHLGNDGDAEAGALEYYDGFKVYAVELVEGYGARLSAPGYMDCTPWAVFDTLEEAEAYLRDEYPQDGDDDDNATD